MKNDSDHLAVPTETSTDTSLVSALQGRADAAYCTYLRLLSDTPCLGAEHKLLTGKFTFAELKAHCKAAEQYGMHKAFTEAINLVSANYCCRPNEQNAVAISEGDLRTAFYDGYGAAVDHAMSGAPPIIELAWKRRQEGR